MLGLLCRDRLPQYRLPRPAQWPTIGPCVTFLTPSRAALCRYMSAPVATCTSSRDTHSSLDDVALLQDLLDHFVLIAGAKFILERALRGCIKDTGVALPKRRIRQHMSLCWCACPNRSSILQIYALRRGVLLTCVSRTPSSLRPPATGEYCYPSSNLEPPERILQ